MSPQRAKGSLLVVFWATVTLHTAESQAARNTPWKPTSTPTFARGSPVKGEGFVQCQNCAPQCIPISRSTAEVLCVCMYVKYFIQMRGFYNAMTHKHVGQRHEHSWALTASFYTKKLHSWGTSKSLSWVSSFAMLKKVKSTTEQPEILYSLSGGQFLSPLNQTSLV